MGYGLGHGLGLGLGLGTGLGHGLGLGLGWGALPWGYPLGMAETQESDNLPTANQVPKPLFWPKVDFLANLELPPRPRPWPRPYPRGYPHGLGHGLG